MTIHTEREIRKKEYESFLMKNDCALSIPLTYNRTNIFGDSMNIYQQLDDRIYFGYKKGKETTTRGSIKRREKQHNQFVTSTILQEFPGLYGVNIADEGLHISVLLGFGVNKYTSIEELLLLGYSFIQYRSQHSTTQTIKGLSEIQTIQKSSAFLQNIHIQSILNQRKKSAQGLPNTVQENIGISSFVPCKYPHLLSKHMQGNSYLGLDEIVHTNKLTDSIQSFDIIFRGSHKKSQPPHQDIDREEIKNEFSNWFTGIIESNTGLQQKNKIVAYELSTKSNLLAKKLTKNFEQKNTYCFHLLLYALSKLFSPLENQNQKKIIDILQLIQDHQFSPRNSRQHIRGIISYFIQSHLYRDGKLAIITNDCGLTYGNFAIISIRDTVSRKEIMEICHQLESKKQGEVLGSNRLYTQCEKKGLQIEQRRSKGMQSSELPTVGFILRDISGFSLIDEYRKLKNHSYDIVLNLVEHKIYVAGEKATSKDIHSQSMMIEVLQTLLEKEGHIIANSELHQNSYTKSKNEMTSKLISPFTKFVEKKLGKKIKLLCHGSLHSFSIKREIDDFSIGRIQQL